MQGEDNVSIAYLKSLCGTYPVDIDREFYIEGIVKSSDVFGDFYKTLVVEDQTGGIEIRVDREALFSYFPRSSKVRVRCNGLTIGNYGKVVQLGIKIGGSITEIGRIPSDQAGARIKVTQDAMTNTEPLVVTILGLTPRYISCYVCLENVQFVDQEQGLKWCETTEDCNRHLTDSAGNIIIVRVSSRFSAAQNILPSGSGFVEGILSYFNDSYQLRIFDPRYVVFD